MSSEQNAIGFERFAIRNFRVFPQLNFTEFNVNHTKIKKMVWLLEVIVIVLQTAFPLLPMGKYM